MQNKVITLVQTPDHILNTKAAFVVPTYQRPYVWPDEDAAALFDDIVKACCGNEPHYYIGTVITSRTGAQTTQQVTYELVDGQQRITTLMLIALAFRNAKETVSTPLAALAVLDGRPRLSFAIRDQVQALLGCWAGLPDCEPPGESEIQKNPYLTRLAGVLTVLQQRVASLDGELCVKVAGYIVSQVKWVNNIMPPGMDLNRLFDTANTAGVQLEQSDILKALLLRQITTDKAVYEAIWQACEQMDDYFERNVRKLFRQTVWQGIVPEQLAVFDPHRFLTAARDPDKSDGDMTIAGLAGTRHAGSATGHDSNAAEENVKKDIDAEMVYCTSIISFPLLLLHAYRICLIRSSGEREDTEGRFHSGRLIDTFRPLTNASEDEVKSFLHCLWQVRYQFDRWVVKWTTGSEAGERTLRLATPGLTTSGANTYITRRPDEISALSQLQSVCLFTGERATQYWLTPFLGWLAANNPQSAGRHSVLEQLEWIDNCLSLTATTQRDASRLLLKNSTPLMKPVSWIKTYLDCPRGTGFEHYWFQKLEYLLWKQPPACLQPESPAFRQFRIRSRNSVEHVHPQNEKWNRTLGDGKQFLDAFGNLVLLSPGENSSYSNHPVERKKADFYGKPVYDSLKLAHMFSLMLTPNGWGADEVISHQATMTELLTGHYQARLQKPAEAPDEAAGRYAGISDSHH